jgi:hypothetical protein
MDLWQQTALPGDCELLCRWKYLPAIYLPSLFFCFNCVVGFDLHVLIELENNEGGPKVK